MQIHVMILCGIFCVNINLVLLFLQYLKLSNSIFMASGEDELYSMFKIILNLLDKNNFFLVASPLFQPIWGLHGPQKKICDMFS